MGVNLSELKDRNKATGDLKESIWSRDINLFSKVINDKKKEEFYSELAMLLKSGFDLRSSLEIFCDSQDKKEVKKIFKSILNQVISGSSISDAILETKLFSDYEIYSIQIGEESSEITAIFKELSIFYQRKLKQKKQLVGAFTYPIMIFSTALIAVIFMMNFIVPLFADSFSRFGGELPALTLYIIKISDLLKDYGWIIMLSSVILVVVIYRIVHVKTVKNYLSTLVLKLPIVGSFVREFYLARFCQSMRLMISSQTPLVRALNLVGRMVEFYPLQIAFVKLEQDLINGVSLYEAMGEFPIFDRKMVSLVKIGSSTNNLADVFQKLYDQYTEELDHKSEIMGSLMEPFLLVFVGGFVAVILVAMYLPMFKLGGSMF